MERNHREYKGPLQLRPCYHRSSERIRAHVMLTILAANCVRMLEMKTGESIADLRKHFDRIMATQVTEYGRRVWKCSELSEADRATLKRAGAGDPPATWQAWRESLETAESQSA